MNKNIFGRNFTRILTLLSFGAAVVAANGAPGDLDTTFGGSGKMRVGVGGGFDRGNAVARQSDGKLVVAGAANGLFGVVRILGSTATADRHIFSMFGASITNLIRKSPA